MAALLVNNPLTQADYTAIQRALAALNDLCIKCDAAEEAGHDVSGERGAIAYYRDLFARHKKVYFPNKQ